MLRVKLLLVAVCLANCFASSSLLAQAHHHGGHQNHTFLGGAGPGGGTYTTGHRRGGNYFGNSYSSGYYQSGVGNLGFGVNRPWLGGSSFGISIGSPYFGNSFSYYSGPGYVSYYGLNGGYSYAPYYGANYYPQANYIDYYLPPTYYPAEVAYGPQAVKQFLGVDRNFALGPLQAAPRVAAKPVDAIQPVVREIDWEGRRKADKFLVLGEDYFQQQKFNDAVDRFHQAVDAAPDYPEANLRYGFALIAVRRYDAAANALRKAFMLDPQIVKSAFRLDQLYADNRMVREVHEEALAQAALDAPTNGDLLFDVGMWLVFSGQAERSVKFFEKARELGVDVGVEL